MAAFGCYRLGSLLFGFVASLASLFFLARYGYALRLKRSSLPPIFGLAIAVVVSALLLYENASLTLTTSIDLAVYAVVIYKFGINNDDKRSILGLLKLRD
jgi:hypothetical protein